MATNLSIDPALLERALSVSGEKTKKAAVTRALEEFIARRRQSVCSSSSASSNGTPRMTTRRNARDGEHPRRYECLVARAEA